MKRRQFLKSSIAVAVAGSLPAIADPIESGRVVVTGTFTAYFALEPGDIWFDTVSGLFHGSASESLREPVLDAMASLSGDRAAYRRSESLVTI